MTVNEKREPVNAPLACTLRPGELEARADDLLPGLIRNATQRIRIDGGYRFEFVPSRETLNAITNVIDAERQCCRFLRFTLTVEPDLGPMRLDVIGPPGTQEFLDALVPTE